MEIRFPFSVHQLSKVVNCIDPCGTMRCILLEDKQAVSAQRMASLVRELDGKMDLEWNAALVSSNTSVGLLWIDGSERKGWGDSWSIFTSLPASFVAGIRRSKLTSETFDQSAERLQRDQLCEQCAKLAPKLPG
ncbi:hypothetical protein T11_2281 [Trichinella zimbabwensis]|uniref:Uncharacterized protein n=1 Tax=Trichinella zimbabwensis TaxID=268475 RepID=A0A0V1I112_9BILA|nr:hypothetical protein T11_2281 [Trichinella zimbabwensis]